MAIDTLTNRQFFQWTPPENPGSVTVNFGIYDIYSNIHPLVLIYDPLTYQYNYMTLDIHYTLSDITSGLDPKSSFKLNYTQAAIDDFTESGVLVVFRNTALTQIVKYQEGNSLPVAEFGDSYDKLTMMAQDAFDIFNLSIRIPFEDMYDGSFNPLNLPTLPNINGRKNKYLAFDDSGNPVAVEVIDVSTIAFSDWGRTLVNLPDSDAGRVHIDCAKTDGDSSQTFSVGIPTLPEHAVRLQTLNEIVSSIDNTSKNNLLENSQFYISQRGFLSGSDIPFTENKFFIDRWQSIYGGDATLTTSVTTDRPSNIQIPFGMPYRSQKLKVVSEGSTIGADEILGFQHCIEDRNSNSIQNGYITLGVWVKTIDLVLGVGEKLCIAIVSGDDTLSYVYEYETIDNTWTYITFSVNVEGLSILTFDGSIALKIMFTLDCGINMKVATNESWYSGKAVGTSNQVSFSSQENAEFFYCNPVIVPGSNALLSNGMANLKVDYGEELNRCKRFLKPFNFPQNVNYYSDGFPMILNFQEEMASDPLIEFDGHILLKFNLSGETSDYEGYFKLANYYDESEYLNKKGGKVLLSWQSGDFPGIATIYKMNESLNWFVSCEI